MLTLEACTVIEAIQRRGSYAAAASELDRVPSAISYTVQKLEQDLGVTLFRKEGRRAVLTPAGEVLAEGAVRLLQATRELTTQVQQTATGWEPRLDIVVETVVDRAPVWRAIEALYEVHPTIDLSVSVEVLGGTWEALFSDRAGLIIGAVENLPDHYRKARQGIRVLPYRPIRMCFVAAPTHPVTTLPQPLSREDLEAHRGVVISDTALGMKALDRGTIRERNLLHVDSIEEKLNAHLQGLGIGLLPAHLVQPYLDDGRLVALETEVEDTEEPSSIAFRTSNRGKAMQFLVNHLTR